MHHITEGDLLAIQLWWGVHLGIAVGRSFLQGFGEKKRSGNYLAADGPFKHETSPGVNLFEL